MKVSGICQTLSGFAHFRAIKSAVSLKGRMIILDTERKAHFRAIKSAVSLKGFYGRFHVGDDMNFRAIKSAVSLKD